MRPFAHGFATLPCPGELCAKVSGGVEAGVGGMKVTKFEHFHVDCGWEIYSFLKISTDEGLTGWSEFREHRRPGIAAAIYGMGEFVVGQEPRPLRWLQAALHSFTRSISRRV